MANGVALYHGVFGVLELDVWHLLRRRDALVFDLSNECGFVV